MFSNATIAVLKYGYCRLKIFWRTRGKETRSIPSFLVLAVEMVLLTMYTKRKVERIPKLNLPPSRACGICRNRMNQSCVEECAPEGDYRYFEPDLDRPIDTLPKLTFQEYLELPGSMKGKWLFVQLTKLQEALDGTTIELGPAVYRHRSGKIPEALKVAGVFDDSPEKVTVYQAERAPDSDKRNGPTKVGRSQLHHSGDT
jgi:hypothetical protein